MADFPPAGMENKEDAGHYGYSVEDNCVRSSKDNEISLFVRARHKRRPRRTFTTGFTDINDAEKNILEAFYLAKHTALHFTWVLPHTVNTGAPQTVTVRITSAPVFEYAGVGFTSRWNVKFTLEEV